VVLSVAYRSQPALAALAGDLARQSLCPALWLVVDNSPTSAPLRAAELVAACDGLEIQLLPGGEGEGFGAGCNRGFLHLNRLGWRGWVWLLNPDTTLPGGDELERLVDSLDGLPERSVVGTAVLTPCGRLEPSGGWIDPGLNFRRRRLEEMEVGDSEDGRPGRAPLPLDWVSGCSLALRPEAHSPPARFDPAFPLYYEDMDLCLRLFQAGSPILWLPAPVVGHRRGAGSDTPTERRLRLSTESYVRFLRRHLPAWVLVLRVLRLLLNALLRLPLQPRLSLAALRGLGAACGPWPAEASLERSRA